MTVPKTDHNLVALRHLILALLASGEYTRHEALYSALRNILLRTEDTLGEPHTNPTRKERRR